jgi:hypothetical protein
LQERQTGGVTAAFLFEFAARMSALGRGRKNKDEGGRMKDEWRGEICHQEDL